MAGKLKMGSMKFTPPMIRAAVAGAFVVSVISAHATSTGLSTDPMGTAWDRLNANTGFAIWDTFPSTSYSNDAPDSASAIIAPVASQSSTFTNFAQGAGLYDVATSTPATGTGDVLFPGGNTVTFALGGSVSFMIYGVVLQIKRPGSTGTLADAGGFAPTLSINGAPGISADQISLTSGSGDTSSTAGTWSVTTWYWGASLAALPDTGSTAFSVNFSKTGSQRLVDGFSIDVGNTAVVPEPTACGLLIGGLGMVTGLRRPRRTAAGIGGI